MEKTGTKREGDDTGNANIKKSKTESTPTENFIDFKPQPQALTDITLLSIAVRLWTEPDIIDDVRNHSRCHGTEIITTVSQKAHEKLEGRVLDKAFKLCLPDLLKRKVSFVVRPIGFQLLGCFDWNNKEYCNLKEIINLGGSVYWTANGIIDKVKSLTELIKEGEIKNFFSLYQLACKYCLEECISDLWGKISSEQKSKLDWIYNGYDYHIIAYWTELMKGESCGLLSKIKHNDYRNIYDSNSSIYRNMISLSILLENAFAVKYFWTKLTELEKNIHTEIWLLQIMQQYTSFFSKRKDEYHKYQAVTDILCFLLSQLSNQSQIFRTHSEIILRALFYDWPFQRYFLPTVSAMLNYLHEDVFVKIISCISREIKEGRSTHELFREIWHRSSLKLKTAYLPFIMHPLKGVITNLLKVGDIYTICTVLENYSAEQKRNIIFNLIGNEALFKLLYSNQLTFLDKLLTNTLTSDCDINRFKTTSIFKFADKLFHDWITHNNFYAADEYLTWSFVCSDKIDHFKKNEIKSKEIFTSLICLGDYKLINKFLNWVFESENDIISFKTTFIEDGSQCWNLLIRISGYDDAWHLFEKFINFTLDSPEKTAGFKSSFLECVKYFLEIYRFDFATNFLNWCLGSKDEVNQFKRDLLLSERGFGMIIYDIERKYPDWSNVKNIIQWFSPISGKAVDIIKRDLDEDYMDKNIKLALFHLLDNFKDCASFSESESASSDEENFWEKIESDTENTNVSNSSENSESCEITDMMGNLSDIDINMTDSDGDELCATDPYDEDVMILLVEMLNTIERDLL